VDPGVHLNTGIQSFTPGERAPRTQWLSPRVGLDAVKKKRKSLAVAGNRISVGRSQLQSTDSEENDVVRGRKARNCTAKTNCNNAGKEECRIKRNGQVRQKSLRRIQRIRND
jgi:hypothetical protein